MKVTEMQTGRTETPYPEEALPDWGVFYSAVVVRCSQLESQLKCLCETAMGSPLSVRLYQLSDRRYILILMLQPT